MIYTKAVQILKATIGIASNSETHLPQLPFPIEVKSLHTDFFSVEEVPFQDDLDGYISIEDSEEEAWYRVEKDTIHFRGPFNKMRTQSSDLRFTFWGNQGFLYRYTLFLLEKKHHIYNLHACALYEKETQTLFVIIGGAGSGKTVYLLSGLAQGLQLFSTETVHFSIEEGGIRWYLGSLLDNIRYGNLIYDFPQFLPPGPTPDPDQAWQKKIALDLSSYRTDFDEVLNPKSVVILFPHIEQGRQGFQLTPVDDKRKSTKFLFDNISQKITETVVLFDSLPFLGLDEEPLAVKRLNNIKHLMQHPSIRLTASVLTNPKDCWGNLLNTQGENYE
ncbi:hypothetical protein ACFLT9_00140 [Acidobacteriota bacterium]